MISAVICQFFSQPYWNTKERGKVYKRCTLSQLSSQPNCSSAPCSRTSPGRTNKTSCPAPAAFQPSYLLILRVLLRLWLTVGESFYGYTSSIFKPCIIKIPGHPPAWEVWIFGCRGQGSFSIWRKKTIKKYLSLSPVHKAGLGPSFSLEWVPWACTTEDSCVHLYVPTACLQP